MKQAILFLFLTAASALPMAAQSTSTDEFMKEFEEFSESAKEFFQGLIHEFGPALEGLRDRVPDFGEYHAPEVLPNGDIIIRRKTPLPQEKTEPNEPSNNTTEL